MRKRIAEETVLFVSILKWVFLSTVIGVIVGAATTLFLFLLDSSIRFSNGFNNYFLILPVAMFASALITKYIAPEAEGHGTEKVIEAVHKRSGKINAAVVPVKLFTTIITIASGGSAGKEGPCAQIGGGLSSVLADIFRFDKNDRKKFVICGISAGFAAVFGTPIAGAIFGVEVLFIGSILYDVLLPSFIAGVTAYQVSAALGTSYFYHPMKFIPVFSEMFFMKVVLAGIFFGICSFVFVEILRTISDFSKGIKLWGPAKAFLGGSAVAGLAMIFSQKYLGLGLDTIEGSLTGAKMPWYSAFLKTVFTSITLGFGGSGGIVTPIFFVGATAGNIFGQLMHLDIGTFSAIGFVSVLAGAANTPIAASIMAVEMFGPAIAPYAAVACVISFLMTGHRSVYPSQILSTGKSSSIKVEDGCEIEDIDIRINPREKSAIGLAARIIRAISRRKDH